MREVPPTLGTSALGGPESREEVQQKYCANMSPETGNSPLSAPGRPE